VELRNPGWWKHVKNYLHRDGHFSDGWPDLCQKMVLGMQAAWIGPLQCGERGADSDAISAQSLNVRCIEYHTYNRGGGLTSPGHCDAGSALTLSVMLSDPECIEGGQFVTFTDGTNGRR
jgi:hypothetical protein